MTSTPSDTELARSLNGDFESQHTEVNDHPTGQAPDAIAKALLEFVR
jgi:hypothetical protein